MRYAFAGNRKISCAILDFMLGRGFEPLALLVTNHGSGYGEELIRKANLQEEFVFIGDEFKKESSIEILKALDLDYIIGIHFPYIIPSNVLKLPKIGFLNLHPSYLPYNKGWHTPSWAILDNSPYGATLHFMTEELDQGDIIHQKKISASRTDTANSLYQKVLKLEEKVFLEAFEEIVAKRPRRIPQEQEGTAHSKKDLLELQEINVDEKTNPLDLIDRLRALTTNKKSEAAYFIVDGKKIGINVDLFELKN